MLGASANSSPARHERLRDPAGEVGVAPFIPFERVEDPESAIAHVERVPGKRQGFLPRPEPALEKGRPPLPARISALDAPRELCFSMANRVDRISRGLVP